MRLLGLRDNISSSQLWTDDEVYGRLVVLFSFQFSLTILYLLSSIEGYALLFYITPLVYLLCTRYA